MTDADRIRAYLTQHPDLVGRWTHVGAQLGVSRSAARDAWLRGTAPTTRPYLLRVRLSEAEHAKVRAAAGRAGVSVAEYVRGKL